MYVGTSENWDLAIRSGMQRRFKANIYTDIANGNLLLVEDLNIHTWSMMDDRRSDVRRTAQMTIVDSDILYELQAIYDSPFRPYGSEIRLYSGFSLPDGSEEIVPMGVFTIESVKFNEIDDYISFELVDRMKFVQRATFSQPVSASGWFTTDYIDDIVVRQTLPWVVIEFADLPEIQLPGGASYQGNRLEAVKALSESIGAELYFDRDGVGQCVPIPYVAGGFQASEANWVINAGEDGVLIGASSEITRKDTYNKVNVIGTAPDSTTPPPYGFDQDGNPSSPTYYYGAFGQVDLNINKQELVNADQCRWAAQSKLRDVMGLSKTISLENLDNPALDAGDIISVVFPDGRNEVHLADAISRDQSGKATIQTRVQLIQ